MTGHYFYDLETHENTSETLIVRAGSPRLKAFHWLPARPSFGSKIADTGLRASHFSQETWAAFKDAPASPRLAERNYWVDSIEQSKAELPHLVRYAATRSEQALSNAWQSIDQHSEDDLNLFFDSLLSIASESEFELAIIQEATRSPTPMVQKAALTFASRAETMGLSQYADMLADASVSSDEQLQGAALTVLSERTTNAHDVTQSSPVTRTAMSQLLVRAQQAARIIASGQSSKQVRLKGFEAIDAVSIRSAGDTFPLLTTILTSQKAKSQDRIKALNSAKTLRSSPAPAPFIDAIFNLAKTSQKKEQALALSALAQLAPSKTETLLKSLSPYSKLSKERQIAIANAWGTLVENDTIGKVDPPLKSLLASNAPFEVRGAALTAQGAKQASISEEYLSALQNENIEIVRGAALGIAKHLKHEPNNRQKLLEALQVLKKGSDQHQLVLAQSFAQIAKHHPNLAFEDIRSAALTKNAPLMRAGVRGLCNALAVNDPKSKKEIERLLKRPSKDLKSEFVKCVEHTPATRSHLVPLLLPRSKQDQRLQLGRALVESAYASTLDDSALTTFEALLKDDNSDTRRLALEGISALGSSLPPTVKESVVSVFKNADLDEKTTILEMAPKLKIEKLPELALADPDEQIRVAGTKASLLMGLDLK